MTQTVTPTRKSDVDPTMYLQLKEQSVEALAQEYVNRSMQNQFHWHMPQKIKWSGDLFDWSGMHEPFDRNESNKSFVKAIQDPNNPGVSGDLGITTSQIDYLAVMERAFRARHTCRWPRVCAHMLGRRRGHGNEEMGLFKFGVLGAVRGMVKQSSPTPKVADSDNAKEAVSAVANAATSAINTISNAVGSIIGSLIPGSSSAGAAASGATPSTSDTTTAANVSPPPAKPTLSCSGAT